MKKEIEIKKDVDFCIKKGCYKSSFNRGLCEKHQFKTKKTDIKKDIKKGIKPLQYEYKIWAGMKQRCLNINNPGYKNYGGRGISVCERWLTFSNFIDDMGERPSKTHSIDRVNNNGNYEPTNCRWATPLEQSNNTRASKGGVFWSETNKCFIAQMTFNKKLYNLGQFGVLKVALEYRQKAFELAVSGRPAMIKKLKKPYSYIKELREWQRIMRNFYGSNKKMFSICESWSDYKELKGFFVFIEQMGKMKKSQKTIILKKNKNEFNKTNCIWD